MLNGTLSLYAVASKSTLVSTETCGSAMRYIVDVTSSAADRKVDTLLQAIHDSENTVDAQRRRLSW